MTQLAEGSAAKTPLVLSTRDSYRSILNSTALIGASSAINIGFSILRLKAFAVLLGPAGVGLFGLYSSLLDVAQAVAGLGVQTSGVRQIADAQGNDARVALTIVTIRRVSLALAMVGALGFVVAAPWISSTMAGDGTIAAILMLAFALALRIIGGGQIALLQGKRHIADLAKVNTIGAGASTIAAIPLIYLWGTSGIAASLAVVAGVGLATSWWYSRKIELPAIEMRWPAFSVEAKALLRLGAIFMISAVLTLASAYVVRLIVLQHDGLLAAGLYQAAWTIGGLYASFILQAMGADFYPRLTSICHDEQAGNRLVNEQVQVSLLLAGPGVLMTLTLAPLVLSVLYSHEFVAAVDLLRWICLGMMLRVLAWPLGYIIVARAANRVFFWTEIAATTVHLLLAWILVKHMGVLGAGIAFFGLYVWHGILVYLIVRSMTGFRWWAANMRLIALFTGATGLVMAASALLPLGYAAGLSIVTTALCSAYALKMLLGLLSDDLLPARLYRIVRKLRLA